MAQSTLDPEKVVETAETLQRRIRERFPERHLPGFASEVVETARQAVERTAWIRKPILPLRVGVWLFVTALLLLGGISFRESLFQLSASDIDLSVQTFEALLSSLVFAGAAVIFLLTLEHRVKRKRALRALHELRGLAHVIDMHQLTKDPKTPALTIFDTASSPKLELSPYELSRYLDYCSELLALVSKISALYAHDFDDPVILAGVDGLQRLIDGLSQKIWHKMSLIDRLVAEDARRNARNSL